jgi:hypothetical protein
MVADAIVLNLTYAYAWRIDDSLGTGGTGDIPINPSISINYSKQT